MEWFYIITTLIMGGICISLNNKLLKEREKQTLVLGHLDLVKRRASELEKQFNLYKALYNDDQAVEIINMIDDRKNERLKRNGNKLDDAILELENLKVDIIELFSPLAGGGIKNVD